jgi:dual specificity phosphatase 12
MFDKQLKGENIYVYCKAGISRSATIVIAFLMKKHSHSAKDTIQTVRKIRNKTEPNDGFCSQLELWKKMSYNLFGNNREYRLVLLKHSYLESD